MAADRAALEQVADRLLAARFPVLLAEYTGRAPNGSRPGEARPRPSGGGLRHQRRLEFPNRHPLNVSMDRSVFATPT